MKLENFLCLNSWGAEPKRTCKKRDGAGVADREEVEGVDPKVGIDDVLSVDDGLGRLESYESPLTSFVGG
ncbi:hypothetical protein COP2_036900 [Malus domestica]